MSDWRTLLRLVVLIAGVASSSLAPAQSSDESAIVQLQTRQADAWNRHDAAAYASLFTQDGDVVNVLGWLWHGRAEIERKLTAAFAFVFKDSRLVITDVRVRPLSPTVAVAHVRWTMTGMRTPPGMPEPREGIQLQVLTKLGNEWLIASFQNTISIPEFPFPSAPPAAGATKP